MTISVPPEGNNARELNSYFAPLKVEAQVAVNMTVRVAAGSFWSAAGEHVEYVGGNSPVITAAGANAKWVIITITEAGVLNVIDGVDSTNPVQPTIPTDELVLAGIFIGDTATYITSDMVFDLRPLWQTHSDLSTDLSTYYTMVQTDNLLNAKADTTGTPEVAFILNADQTGVTSTDVMITAERGDEDNTHIRWFEGDDKWQFTNDGTIWSDLGADVTNLYSKASGVAPNIVIFGAGDTLADSGSVVADFATSAQGTLADSATQPLDNISTLTNDSAFISDITAEAVGSLSDVNVAAPAVRHALMYDGVDSWDNRVLVEADISDLGTYEPANANIQTHIADATIHFTEASISITKTQISDFVEADYATGAEGDLASTALQNVVEDTAPQLGGMLDVNTFGIGDGTLALVTFVEDASAVNNIQIENEATLSGPIISAVGTDTDIDINVNPKGIGALKSGGVVVALVGDSYSKTESDAAAGNLGAKVDKVAGTSGNLVEFGASSAIVDSTVVASKVVVREAWSTISIAGPSTITAGSRVIADTTANVIGITLPVGAMGAEVEVVDGGNNADTFNITITPDGAELIGGVNAAVIINTANGATALVYTGATAGWVQKY